MNRKTKVLATLLAVMVGITGVSSNAISGKVTAEAAIVSLNTKKLNLNVGDTYKLKVTGVKAKKIKKAVFKTNEKNVVTVSAKGKVVAKEAGNATITAKVILTTGKKYNKKCAVEVTDEINQKTPVSEEVVQGEEITETDIDTENNSEETGSEQTGNSIQNTAVSGEIMQVVHDMGLGINLGNTFEACGDWINESSVANYEQAWGSSLITKKTIQGYADAGFKTIRIPVAWSNMMSNDGKYTINPDYQKRVDEVVNWALDCDMYVILNIHWDGGWWAMFGSKDMSDREEAMKKYKAVWTQLSEHYKNYSAKLIFESANEELGGGLNRTDNFANSGSLSADEEFETTNKINQTFVDIVRKSGEKNANRYLLIAGIDTNIARTCDARYVMPTDTVKDRLMVSVHYYSDCTYDSSTGEAERKKAIAAFKTTMNSMKNIFINKGIPVIIGEYGVNVVTAEPKDEKYHPEFYKALCEYSIENGACPVLWNTPGVIYDRENGKFTDTAIAKTYKTIADNLSSYAVYSPKVTEGSFVWTGKLGLEGWCITDPALSGDSSINLLSAGGVYEITGVDWDLIKNPVLEVAVSNGSGAGNIAIKCDTEVVEQPYWFYIDGNGKVKESGIGKFDTKVIDLSSLNLTGKQTLYMALADAETFSADFTIKVREK